MSPVEKTVNLDFGKLKPPNLTLPPPYPANDYFVPSLSPTQKSTKLMEFNRIMGVRSTSLVPAMERTIRDFVKKETVDEQDERMSFDKNEESELKSSVEKEGVEAMNSSKPTTATQKLGRPLHLPNLPTVSSSIDSQTDVEMPQTSDSKPPIPPTRRSLQPSSPRSNSPIALPTKWQPITRIEIMDDQSTRVCIDPDALEPPYSVVDLTGKRTEANRTPSSSINPYSVVDLTSLDS
jgi:hypothetical protein